MKKICFPLLFLVCLLFAASACVEEDAESLDDQPNAVSEGSALCTAMGEELKRIQQCTSDEECGQIIQGTSCGCTMEYVARLDVDISTFQSLKEDFLEARTSEDNCPHARFGSDCGCPEADGFICQNNTCNWNYTF